MPATIRIVAGLLLAALVLALPVRRSAQQPPTAAQPSRPSLQSPRPTPRPAQPPTQQPNQPPAQQSAQPPTQQPAQPPAQPPGQTEAPNPPNPDDVVRISTQLVQIDAVVTDKKGNHIEDLGEDDFEMLVDGKREKISYFKHVKLPDTSNAGGPAPATKEEKKAAAAAPIVPGRTLAPEAVRRTIAFVVDDLGLSFESTAWTRDAIRKFVREQMQDGDLVAIIRTGRGLGALQQFTSDRRILNLAIDKLTWNPQGRDMIPRFAPASGSVAADPNSSQEAREAEARNEDFRETVFSVGTLGALNFVVRGLRELPGRKSAILISDGFRLFGRERDSTQVLDQVRRLTDLANRASVVVYSIDAKGLLPLTPTAADDTSRMTQQQQTDRYSQMSQENFDSQEGLTFLARETGGLAMLNSNDLNLGIRRALQDQNSYYLLGFDPEDDKFDKRYHSIKMKVTRPGLSVRTRAGFLGIADRARPPAPVGRDAQIQAALFSPFGARDLSLQMTSLFFNAANQASPNQPKDKNAPDNVSFVRSLLNIKPENLSFTDGPDGTKKLKLEIATFTFNEAGAIIEQHGRAFSLDIPQETYPKILKYGFNYSDDFIIKKPGAYQLRAVLRDPDSGRLGSAGQFIQVPDLSKKRLAVSGIMLATVPPAAGDPAAPKQPEDDNVQPTPSVRSFARSGTIDYGAVVYNAALDAAGKPQLTMQLEIYRDGKVLSQLPARSVDASQTPDPKRVPCGGTLKLTSFPPGEYVLRLSVTDALAKAKFARVDQWIDFTVR